MEFHNETCTPTLVHLPADIVRKLIPLMGSDYGPLRLVSRAWNELVLHHFYNLKRKPAIDYINIQKFDDNFSILFKIAKKNAHFYFPLVASISNFQINTSPGFKFISIVTSYRDDIVKNISLTANLVDFNANGSTEQYGACSNLMKGSTIGVLNFIKTDLKESDRDHIISLLTAIEIKMIKFKIEKDFILNDARAFLLDMANLTEGIGVDQRDGHLSYLFDLVGVDIPQLLLDILKRKTSTILIHNGSIGIKTRAEMDQFADNVAAMDKEVWMEIYSPFLITYRVIHEHIISTGFCGDLPLSLHVKHILRHKEEF